MVDRESSVGLYLIAVMNGKKSNLQIQKLFLNFRHILTVIYEKKIIFKSLTSHCCNYTMVDRNNDIWIRYLILSITIYSVYGQNATVITAAITGHATKVPLA